jgi:23S rRNA pseudouridine2605 synthase
MTKSKTETDTDSGERIAKRLARAGLCSRRDAERWIAEGRVAVNGTVLTTPAVVVRPGDQIIVDGNPLPDAEPTRLWRYHKPDGLVTTARDEKGRATVFEKMPPELPRVVSVGRLDLTTEGLLLLTNDGELARLLELPATGWLRRYRVRVHGQVNPERLAALADGITIDGLQYGSIEASLDRQQGSNAWITVGLREGKNREIRKVMEVLGLEVTRLIRIAYGPFQLGKLPRGGVEEVPRRVLRDQMPRFFAEQKAREESAAVSEKPRTEKPGSAKPAAAKTSPALLRPKAPPKAAGKPAAKPMGRPSGKPTGKPTGQSPSGALGRRRDAPADRPAAPDRARRRR